MSIFYAHWICLTGVHQWECPGFIYPNSTIAQIIYGASSLSTEFHAIDMALSRWDRADLVIHSDFLGDIQKLSNGLSNRPLLRQVQLTTLDRQDRVLLTGVTCNDSVDALTKEAALIPTLPTKTFCFVVTMRSEMRPGVH